MGALLRRQKHPCLDLAAAGIRRSGQRGQGAHRVVAANQVERGSLGGRRVMLAQCFQEMVHPFGGKLAGQEADQGLLERVAHHMVVGAAEQKIAVAAVTDLVAGILPDLAEQDGVIPLSTDSQAKLPEEAVRQFVGHIQAPARRAQTEPMSGDPVRASDFLPVGQVMLVDTGQIGKTPPGIVEQLIALAMEAIPAAVR